MHLALLLLFPAKPRIQPAPSVLKALSGQTVMLPCVVQGEPRPEVSWFHNGLPVALDHTTPLRIQQASLANQGTYRCVAKNSAGQEILEIKLEILGDYKILSDHLVKVAAHIQRRDGKVVLVPFSYVGQSTCYLRRH